MIDVVTILLAAVVSYVIGMLWYSPVLFGYQWMKLSKMHNAQPNKAVFLLGFAGTLLITLVLSYVIDAFGATTILSGAGVGALVWLGFIAPIMANTILYEKTSVQLYLINVSHYLVISVISGIILAVW